MYINRLVSIASPFVASRLENDDDLLDWKDRGARFDELIELLSRRNGFYAFESALHIFPWVTVADANDIIGLQDGNAPNAWRKWYQDLLDQIIFFAKDIFGVQFGIAGDDIVRFDPEAGMLTCWPVHWRIGQARFLRITLN